MVRQCVNILYNLYGYILQVDTEYPDELHNLHNDYPLAPGKLEITLICCQIIQIQIDKYNITVGGAKKTSSKYR